ncbi:N-acetylmuramoyl-L-alanine amidase family protein [Thermoflavimicrobium dichotomicum]|uniref:N-acetylmuramoyl-L-alanine amidase n=1 Tax=Thermoflavimicrobium dichotomicum TaxID=46223 RepID=A0A1I3RJE2_9BACL|nr:N-acetylmuramoyl-L-alanine amidase [Thermoflavimicrobium dichotomicum]SFJ45849.1 N-acetylmuramoyl-L-alanine amidase [Thermoflavimicrobium dichotomicum]
MSILVCLDPGHGGRDQGAIGFSLKEKEVCLDLAYRIERQLRKYEGISVTMTRSIDIDTTPEERSEWANRHHADLFLSIHTNASSDPSATGFASYVSVIAGSKARRIQCWLHNRIVSFLRQFGVTDLGKKNDTETLDGQLMELRQAQMPAITLGSLFITHAKDNVLLRDSYFRDQYAECIAQGIANIYRCQPK